MEKITKAQWEAYRIIQGKGWFNMMSPEAVRASGLDKDVYFQIVKQYEELFDKFEEADDADDE
tara:strand:- start:1953 stop:2141 length:189 start_codon:yes stop_codon:yes gene_type:complete